MVKSYKELMVVREAVTQQFSEKFPEDEKNIYTIMEKLYKANELTEEKVDEIFSKVMTDEEVQERLDYMTEIEEDLNYKELVLKVDKETKEFKKRLDKT